MILMNLCRADRLLHSKEIMNIRMNDEVIKIHDKYFKPYISKEEIATRVASMGAELSKRFQGETVVAIGILNGAFVFMSDLIRECKFETDIRFIKAKSYDGMASTGSITIDKPEALVVTGCHVLLIEDIIDTGFTMQYVVEKLRESKPKSLTVVTLLQKPSALEHNVQIDEVGFSIPPAFVVGYGLDYDDLGRNLPDIYQLAIGYKEE